jgi:hypothetical protein
MKACTVVMMIFLILHGLGVENKLKAPMDENKLDFLT